MKIHSVQITNFRTLKDVTIPFDSVTTFIGPNGVGKSTVLRALDWFFNGKPGSLTEDDCFSGATDESGRDIEVRVTFSDLTDRDREALGKYAPDGVTTFTAWKRRSSSGIESLSANSKSYPPFNDIRSQSSATDRRRAYNELRQQNPTLALPACSSDAAVTQALTAWEAENTSLLIEAPESLQTNFFGFNGGGKMSGLFDFVLVTADLRAGEESIDGKASIIGRILERSIDRSVADEEIATIVEEARVKQQRVYEEKFSAQLGDMNRRLNEVVSAYSTGRSIEIFPAEVQLKAPRTMFDVFVRDGMTETPVERQGHGFQRTLLISALQLLAESGSAASEGVICLAIEEPELFQHPIQAKAFAKVLRSLAEDASKRIQVTYATHSPYFIEARHFSQVRRLSRKVEACPLVEVHRATVDAVKARLHNIIDSCKVDRQLDSLVATRLAEALFANRVFLVEGSTDAAVSYGIGDRRSIGCLEAAGIAIVEVGGKTLIPLAHAIVTTVGIPAYALFDGDGGFEARAAASGKCQTKIDDERRSHATSNRMVLKYFGLAEEDFPSTTVTDAAAILDDHLEDFLFRKWSEWQSACDTVSTDAGVNFGKNELAYRIATLKAVGEVPAELNQILAKAEGEFSGAGSEPVASLLQGLVEQHESESDLSLPH